MNNGVYMRIIVMFDLPVQSKKQRREATTFRNLLLKLGFIMLQFSVYVRICKGIEKNNSLVEKIKKSLPKGGNIRALSITEKQYEDMVILIGESKSSSEKMNLKRSLFEF